MKLPSNLLMKLYLASAVAACEPAHPDIAQPIDQPLVDETLDVRVTSHDDAPAAAPRFASPQPQPSPPPPKLKPKPKTQATTMVCGHPVPADSNEVGMLCGRG